MVPFPPLLAFALGALGAALVVKHFAKDWRRPDAGLNKAEEAPVAGSSQPVRKLRRDPDGIYRP